MEARIDQFIIRVSKQSTGKMIKIDIRLIIGVSIRNQLNYRENTYKEKRDQKSKAGVDRQYCLDSSSNNQG